MRERRDELIVTAVGIGLNLRAIGRMVGRHMEQVRRQEREALERIATRLNEGWEQRT